MNNLLHFLLRHNIVYTNGTHWTGKHEKWLRSLSFEDPLLKDTFDEYFFHSKELEEKTGRMKEKIEEIALRESYQEKVASLKCFRGIETFTALSLVMEIGDFRRFVKAEEFMAFLGLVPSENSSGDKRRQGGITKAGNSHLRRLLVEAGWQYRFNRTVSKRLAIRRKGQNPSVVAYANKAGRRLSKNSVGSSSETRNRKWLLLLLQESWLTFIWGMMAGQLA